MALNIDDVWSSLVERNFVTTTDTFQEFVDAGESELPVGEEASTDDAIVAVVRGSAEVATNDNSDGEDDVNLTPEPDFSCKRVGLPQESESILHEEQFGRQIASVLKLCGG
ncbi:hypothetical protein HPB50_002346 [Hyalomma asiaticum]|uniref:Uncharacterized protein n=1 Tax=Hyalomma asiaticum TaxID=266040 RepID=A0ACB7TD94_HYAAI|nr:hypothetical protein HPB50_002346 [Hyalomma asiaticum]